VPFAGFVADRFEEPVPLMSPVTVCSQQSSR